ncbi:hypothetical protein OG871_40490 (plasmid) [Kitasatospora sp. NBC_00374]|uniref:hypothetical protein n=1 Tax=Kitasatospora sp. NBC_00374 TaxID=2975964 RepID=UPI002F90F880
MSITAEMVLAALAEFARPDVVHSRFEQGVNWAASAVRRAFAESRLRDGAERDLEAVETLLRAWLAKGPDQDSDDYDRGCEYGQQIIRLLLDRDPVHVFRELDDAATNAVLLAKTLYPDWAGP